MPIEILTGGCVVRVSRLVESRSEDHMQHCNRLATLKLTGPVT